MRTSLSTTGALVAAWGDSKCRAQANELVSKKKKQICKRSLNWMNTGGMPIRRTRRGVTFNMILVNYSEVISYRPQYSVVQQQLRFSNSKVHKTSPTTLSCFLCKNYQSHEMTRDSKFNDINPEGHFDYILKKFRDQYK